MATRTRIDVQITALEDDVPALRQDMDPFFHAFEERSEQIWAAAEPQDRDYVFEALEAIIERAGINA